MNENIRVEVDFFSEMSYKEKEYFTKLSRIEFEDPRGIHWDEQKQEYYEIVDAGFISEEGIDLSQNNQPEKKLNREQKRKLNKDKKQ